MIYSDNCGIIMQDSSYCSPRECFQRLFIFVFTAYLSLSCMTDTLGRPNRHEKSNKKFIAQINVKLICAPI